VQTPTPDAWTKYPWLFYRFTVHHSLGTEHDVPKRKPETISEYLDNLEPEQRKTLQVLRKRIQAAAPGAEECISYGIPGFRLNGRLLISFGAAKAHCAVYGSVSESPAVRKMLKEYDQGRGTIRFPSKKPLSVALTRAIVKGRVARLRTKAAKAR
jgi:uncharacterized protein YdhG (YjbR/CyaY superfamily)